MKTDPFRIWIRNLGNTFWKKDNLFSQHSTYIHLPLLVDYTIDDRRKEVYSFLFRTIRTISTKVFAKTKTFCRLSRKRSRKRQILLISANPKRNLQNSRLAEKVCSENIAVYKVSHLVPYLYLGATLLRLQYTIFTSMIIVTWLWPTFCK